MAGLSIEASRHGAADLTRFAPQGRDALTRKLPFGLDLRQALTEEQGSAEVAAVWLPLRFLAWKHQRLH